MPLLLASTFQHFKSLDLFKDNLKSWKVACVITAALCQIDDSPEWPEWMKGEIAAIENLSSNFLQYDLRGKTIDDLNRNIQ